MGRRYHKRKLFTRSASGVLAAKEREGPLLKNKPRGREPKQKRTKYADPSRHFLNWVQGLEFEKTFLGRLYLFLEDQFQVRQILVLGGFSLVLSFLLIYDFEFPYHLSLGKAAPRDIRSPMSFELVDEIATQEKQALEEALQPPIFDYDPSINGSLLTSWGRAVREMRLLLRKHGLLDRNRLKESEIQNLLGYKSEFEKTLGRPISERSFRWLVQRGFNSRHENIIADALEIWGSEKLINNLGDFIPSDLDRIVIREIARPDNEAFTIHKSIIKDLSIRPENQDEANLHYEKLSAAEFREVDLIVRTLLLPNLTLNKKETEARKKAARESVLPVVISVKKNQSIVREGQTVQPIHLKIVEEVEKRKAEKKTLALVLASSMMFLCLLLVMFAYLKRFTFSKVRIESKEITLMGVVTLLMVGITKTFFVIMEAAFLSKYGKIIPDTFFLFLAPVAAGAMMAGLLIFAGEVVWIFSLFLAIALSMMVEMKFAFFVVTMAGSIAAARSVFKCQTRNDIYKAGLRVGLVNAATIALVLTVTMVSEGDLATNLAWSVPAGLLSGILSSMVTMMFIPLLESAFNVTTDVKLLELSNLNHPLLKDMIVKAPGTYHHSLVVGAMCEAAGEEMGANPLLAKVMAYYHDIGKMEHPQYFVENQRPDYNAHDYVTPYMSKTILIAHVKDGAEMAMKYKLGKPIIDGILQHHGTTLISYFYNKALENADEDVDQVSEEDFRYPGPKPQFKEAALVMLADSVEAAARSLEDPTPVRLRNIVKNVIHRKFSDGQLDECNLTLKDLTVIEQVFNRILIGIYHQRIDYPTRPGAGGISDAPPTSLFQEPPMSATKAGRGPATA